LKSKQNTYPDEIFKFPGPFIRNIIHYFDKYALSPNRIQRYYAISNNVKFRENYFPPMVDIKVIYHPSKIEHFECNSFDYLFTASRLDSPKRIEILIQAMKYVPNNIQFKIAGTGPEEEKLIKMAAPDKRIQFVGYTGEENLVGLYANALCILYIPYDEDYGLITVEGMKSKKPVITVHDSGGPLEFVTNNETGFIVDPDPERIAEKINYFIENKEEARRMGMLAYQKVNTITWRNTAAELLNEQPNEVDNKKKILVLSTYSCFPPKGGGQHRIYNLYSRLAKKYDITICSIIEVNKNYTNLNITNGLHQICIPQSWEHAKAQWDLESRVGANLYDACMGELVEKSPEYIHKVKNLAIDSDIVIFSHPFLYSLKKFIDSRKKIIYEAHNVEYLLKHDYIRDKDIISKIFEIEKQACTDSDMIWTTSEEDRQDLVRLYLIPQNKVFLIPNGVDTSAVPYIGNDDRIRSKESVGIRQYQTVLFIGSWHPPNLEALNFIVKLAKKHKELKFLIVGSVKDYYRQEKGLLRDNVLAFGSVEEAEKLEIYKLADIAINPMFSGSGTNLKMLDYMSAGIPVITTSVGARGLCIQNKTDAIICEPDQFTKKIQELLNNRELRESLRVHAREIVEYNYQWDYIAKNATECLNILECEI